MSTLVFTRLNGSVGGVDPCLIARLFTARSTRMQMLPVFWVALFSANRLLI